MTGEKWAAPDIERVRSMIDSGAGYSEIAAALGVSESRLISLCHRQGLRSHRAIPHVTRERIRDLHREGWAATRIARRLRVTVAVVERYAAETEGRRA